MSLKARPTSSGRREIQAVFHRSSAVASAWGVEPSSPAKGCGRNSRPANGIPAESAPGDIQRFNQGEGSGIKGFAQDGALESEWHEFTQGRNVIE